MRRFIVLVFVSVLVLAHESRELNADTLAFDFSSGLGPNFSVINNDGGLWNVGTNGSGLEISKPADPGTYFPTGWIHAGIGSGFVLNGDFTVTVNFTLNGFPDNVGLNESLLNVTPISGPVLPNNGAINGGFSILEYMQGNQQLIETFSEPPSTPLAAADSSITSGSYQLVRSGSTITGLYAPDGSSSFTPIGSYTDPSFTAPMYVELLANQGTNNLSWPRSTTGMDITFDNLVVQADSISGVVPEPSTFALLAAGAVGLVGYALRQRRDRRVAV